MQANQKEDLYIGICAYLKDSEAHARPKGVKLKDYRVSKSLLIKENQLWMPDNKGFWLKVIKKIHT